MSDLIFDLQKFSTQTPLNVIKKFMASLDTTTLQSTAALDEAVSVASDGYFATIQDAINQMVSDCQNSSSADNFLKNYCGINLDNTDTGAITGSDAGVSTVKTATSIVPESGSLNSFTGNSFTINGLTVQLASIDSSYNITELNYNSLTSTQKYIWQALYTWWIPQALKLIAESYGDNFSFTSNSSATTKKIYITFFDGSSGSLASTMNWTTSAGMTTSKIAVMINNYYANTLLNGGNSDGEISTGYLLDRTIAHELTHAVMAANINYHNNLPTFIKEGVAELTDGIDDTQTYTIRNLANNSSSLASALSLSTNYNSYAHAGGYMFMRYLAKQASENNSLYITGTSGADVINNTVEGVTIDALSGNDTVYNGSSNVSINAGTGDDSIYNKGYCYVTINAGDGDDTINAYASSNIHENMLLISGDAGNDSIKNYNDYSTILGGIGNDTIVDHSSYSKIDGEDGADYIALDSTFYSSIDGGIGNDTITGYFSQNLITGGSDNDIIILPEFKEYGKNTIIGGSGNDTIYDNISATLGNIYQYANGDGNDIIYGVNKKDTLQITDAKYTTTKSGEDLIVKVSSGQITLVGGANVAFKINGTLDSGGTDTTPADENTLPTGWKYANTAKTSITATLANASHIDLNEEYGENIIKVDGSKITSGVEIYGNDLNNSIKGGKGADVIAGGYGNDTVSLGGGKDTYIYTGGNDVIQDYATGQDVIKFETSIQNASLNGSNLIITTDEGKITIKSAKDKTVKVIDDSNAIINIVNEYPTVEVDTLPAGWKFTSTLASATWANASHIDLNEEYGENIIKVDGSKITSGVEIYGNDLNNSIKGGKGADVIAGGYGNDTVSLGGGKDTYIYTGGNDVIQDYATGQDVIKFETSIQNASLNGSNLIITTDEGKITVKSAKGKAVKIIDDSDSTFEIVDVYPETVEPETLPDGWKYGTSSKTNTNGAIITATIKTTEDIDLSESYGDEVITVDGSKITSGVEIYGNDENNLIKGGKGQDYISGGDGNDTVLLGAGMDVYIYSGGDDVIQDYLTGVDSIQVEIEGMNYTNANEYITSITSGQNVIFQTSKGDLTVVKNSGKKITLMDENGIEISLGGELPDGWKYGTSSKTNTNGAIITATVKGAENIDLNESYGEGVEIVDGSKTTGIEIIGNDLDNSIKGGTGNNTLGGGYGNDTLVGNTGADIFVYSDGDDRIINYTGGKDTIQIDVDNIAKNTAEKITREVDGEDVIYYVEGAGSFVVQNGKDANITLMDSNGTKLVLDTIPDGWQYNSVKKLLQAVATSAENEINLNEGYGDGVEKVDGSKISGGVEIYGNDLNNSIKGGKGNDILDGGDGNDTLTSGAGDDLFIYSGGDDYITDYAAGKDSIQIDTEEITINDVATVGSNVIYYTDAGNLTVKGGKGKDITLIDANENLIVIGGSELPSGWKFDSAKKLLQATTTSAENIDLTESYGDDVEKVDGSKITGGVEIIGNDNGNSIKGGKGADIITGGTGNDTVSLGGGADIYIYTGGDDFIQDYANADKIQIDENNIEVNGILKGSKDVTIMTSEGNITLKGGKTKTLNLVDANDSPISLFKAGGKVSENIWFLEDDNNFTSNDIDSISKQNFEITNFETENYSTLVQNSDILTFTDEK